MSVRSVLQGTQHPACPFTRTHNHTTTMMQVVLKATHKVHCNHGGCFLFSFVLLRVNQTRQTTYHENQPGRMGKKYRHSNDGAKLLLLQELRG